MSTYDEVMAAIDDALAGWEDGPDVMCSEPAPLVWPHDAPPRPRVRWPWPLTVPLEFHMLPRAYPKGA